MENLFVLLTLISFFLLIIGIFSPKTSLFWYKKERTKKKSLLIYGILLFVSFVAFGMISDNVKNEQATSNIIEKKETKKEPEIQQEPEPKADEISEEIKNIPVERQLAILDGILDKDDIRVIRIKTLLEDLSQRYNQPIDTIADCTDQAKDIFHDRGIVESNLNILEQIHKVYNVPKGMTYKDALMLYVLVRDNQ